MPRKKPGTAPASRPRPRAGGRPRRPAPRPIAPLQTAAELLHELQVHQAELEVQNEELREAQAELAASRDRYLDLFDFAPVGYLTLNQQGTILEANLMAAQLLSLQRQVITGRRLSTFVAPESQDAFYLHRRLILASAQRQTSELALRGAKGATTPVRLESIAYLDPASGARRWRCAVIDLTDLRAAQEAQRRSEEEVRHGLEERVAQRTSELQKALVSLRAMAMRLLVIEERERRHLAADLHDGLGQTLALLRIKTTTLRRQCAPGDPAARPLDEVLALLDESVHGVHTLTYELSPPVLHELGFVAAVRWLGEDIQRRYGLKVLVMDHGWPKTTDEGIGMALLRCARELLVNTAKHARAPDASVTLRARDGVACLEVQDRGVGFASTDQAGPGGAGLGPLSGGSGYGLMSIRTRLRDMGGDLNLRSAPGKGTVVTLSLPLDGTPEAKGAP